MLTDFVNYFTVVNSDKLSTK